MSGHAQASRQAMVEGLDQLKAGGVLGEADQGALIRHLDEQRDTIAARIVEITPEYQRRVADDGLEAANAWLAEQGRLLGEQQGTASRHAVSQLDVSRDA